MKLELSRLEILKRILHTEEDEVKIFAKFPSVISGEITISGKVVGEKPYVVVTLTSKGHGTFEDSVQINPEIYAVGLALLVQDLIVGLEADMLFKSVELTRTLAGDEDDVRLVIPEGTDNITITGKEVKHYHQDTLTFELPVTTVLELPKLFVQYRSYPHQRLWELFDTLRNVFIFTLGHGLLNEEVRNYSDTYFKGRDLLSSEDHTLVVTINNELGKSEEAAFYSNIRGEIYYLLEGSESTRIDRRTYRLLDGRSEAAIRICSMLKETLDPTSFRITAVEVR